MIWWRARVEVGGEMQISRWPPPDQIVAVPCQENDAVHRQIHFPLGSLDDGAVHKRTNHQHWRCVSRGVVCLPWDTWDAVLGTQGANLFLAEQTSTTNNRNSLGIPTAIEARRDVPRRRQ